MFLVVYHVFSSFRVLWSCFHGFRCERFSYYSYLFRICRALIYETLRFRHSVLLFLCGQTVCRGVCRKRGLVHVLYILISIYGRLLMRVTDMDPRVLVQVTFPSPSRGQRGYLLVLLLGQVATWGDGSLRVNEHGQIRCLILCLLVGQLSVIGFPYLQLGTTLAIIPTT